MALIKSIDRLRDYVKINRSKDFTTYEPYVIDAQEKYLEPYIGSELLTYLDDKANDTLNILLCRSLGPFSLALATHEMSIQFGEAGHTVARTDSLAPASDAKIEKAVQSLYERGWSNLDKALSFLASKTDEYQQWESAGLNLKTVYFDSARQFQEKGLVDIDHSVLTYYKLLSFIRRIEMVEVRSLLPDNLKISEHQKLLELIQAYIGSRVAAVHTSKSTRIQRGKPQHVTEFNALIRPLFENDEEDLNYYNEQAALFHTDILNYLSENKLTDSTALEWNEQDKKIFVSNAR